MYHNIIKRRKIESFLFKGISTVYLKKYKMSQVLSDMNTIAMSQQSQKHGFTWENEVREKVFGLPKQSNDTNKHDIPSQHNSLNSNENCSIKTTCSKGIGCGDVLSFFDYDFTKKNTIIVIKYKQEKNTKNIVRIYEIDYNEECHKLLFGNLSRAVIKTYVENVKKIPAKTKGVEARNIFDYNAENNKLEKKYSYKIKINPKVDSSQSRVQCSITNFEHMLAPYITYKSPSESPNMLRGKYIQKTLDSPPRSRGGHNKQYYIDICKQNKTLCKGYSKLTKTKIIELLKSKDLL